MMNEVYLALDKVFHFKYGKILLATASLLELEAMMLKGRPYFTQYSQEIDKCLSGASCKGLHDLLLTLGNLNSYYFDLKVQFQVLRKLYMKQAFTLPT